MKKKIYIFAICVLFQLASPEWDITLIENKKILPFQYLNKNNSFKFLINILCAQPAERSGQESAGEAYMNYFNLKKLYIKWNTDVLKSERRSKKYLYKFLEKIIDRELSTGYDYVIISPEGKFGKELRCNFLMEKWLIIRGEIPQETLSKIAEKNPGILTGWWRSKKLLSVRGKVTDFKVEYSDRPGEVVILYLSGIKLKESDVDSTGKNSK